MGSSCSTPDPADAAGPAAFPEAAPALSPSLAPTASTGAWVAPEAATAAETAAVAEEGDLEAATAQHLVVAAAWEADAAPAPLPGPVADGGGADIDGTLPAAPEVTPAEARAAETRAVASESAAIASSATPAGQLVVSPATAVTSPDEDRRLQAGSAQESAAATVESERSASTALSAPADDAAGVPDNKAATEAVQHSAPAAGACLLMPVPASGERADVTLRGVSLCYLLELVDAGLVSGSATIQQVVDTFVRPSTSLHKCCLFDLIPSSYTGTPRFFVSHTWSREFGDLLDVLKDHFNVTASSDEAAGVLLWLDVVAINQTPYEDKGCLLNDDVANLAKVIKTTEQTLFCLDEKCVALSRIWCLYEVWQSFDAGGAARLLLLMPRSVYGSLEEVFNTFDVTVAEATQQSDRVRILVEIAKSIGPTKMNLTLKRALVDSARFRASNTIDTGEDLASAVHIAARMSQLNGEFAVALPLFRQALQIMDDLMRERAGDPDAPRGEASLFFLSALASCLSDMQQYDEALTLLEELRDTSFAVYGRNHIQAMTANSNLAVVLSTVKRPEEALVIFREALEAAEKELGPTDRNTVSALVNMGRCLEQLRRKDEAKTYHRKAVEAATLCYGALHPETVATREWLGMFLLHNGTPAELREGQAMLDKAYQDLEDAFGVDHPTTLKCKARRKKVVYNHSIVSVAPHGYLGPQFRTAADSDEADAEDTVQSSSQALFTAAENGNVAEVGSLLRLGVDPNWQNPQKIMATPLYFAAFQGHLAVVEMLVAAGASVDLANSSGTTPLMMAARSAHADVVKFLIASGSDVNHVGPDRRSALIMTAEMGHVDMSSVLLAGGANIEQATQAGRTPLLTAAWFDRWKLVMLLIASGAKLDGVTAEEDDAGRIGWTPLMYAVSKAFLPAVEALLARGVSVNSAPDPDGYTPLVVAQEYRSGEVITKLLLSSGADVEQLKTFSDWVKVKKPVVQFDFMQALQRLARQ